MDKQLHLKDKLKSGQIRGVDFLKELMILDQSHPHHPDCFDNIKILEDNEVKNMILNDDEKIRLRYLYDLRFYHFHAFQNLSLVQKKDFDKATYHLKIACELGDECHKLNPDKEDLFLPYIKATLSYVQNDLDSLNRYLNILLKVDQNNFMYVNTKIVQRLKDDLVKNKKPNYGGGTY